MVKASDCKSEIVGSIPTLVSVIYLVFGPGFLNQILSTFSTAIAVFVCIAIYCRVYDHIVYLRADKCGDVYKFGKRIRRQHGYIRVMGKRVPRGEHDRYFRPLTGAWFCPNTLELTVCCIGCEPEGGNHVYLQRPLLSHVLKMRKPEDFEELIIQIVMET